MKKLHLLLVVIAAIAMLSSCKKDDSSDSTSTTSTTAITNDDAAGMVSLSLSENSMGVTGVIENAGTTTTTIANNAGITSISGGITSVSMERSPSKNLKDTAYTQTLSSASGAIISYTQSISYKDTLVAISPLTVIISYSYSGSYNGPLLSSTHSGSGYYTRIDSTGTNLYTLNGIFARASNFITNGTVQKQATAQTNITLKNIVLAKLTHKIQSGTATITISGTTPKQETFSYSGTITFLGSDSATLTINGVSYTVNLVTGDHLAK